MSLKSKGINAERELIHLFWNNGWSACRIAGSGSIKYPAPDVVAGNNMRKIALECKATRDIRQRFSRKQIEELDVFARTFGAEPWVGVRFDRLDWYFFTLEDLKESPEGFSITLSNAKTKGFLFDELIRK